MNYPTLAAATGMTFLGLSGALADTTNNSSKSSTANRASQKAQPQQNQPRQNRAQQEKGQTKGNQTKPNRTNRNRVLIDRTQDQRPNSEQRETADQEPANINTEEARNDRSTDAPLRVTDKTEGDEANPQKFILRDNRGNRLEDRGQANADREQANSGSAKSQKENAPNAEPESLREVEKKDVFSAERRSQTATYFEKQKGQKYNLPASVAEQYRGEEVPEAWKNRSIQRGYQIPTEYQPLLVAAPSDLVELLGDTDEKYSFHLAGSNLVVVDDNYEVVDVIYLPTVGV